MVSYMSDVTTIQIKRETLKILKEIKEYPRQTYSDLLSRMALIFKESKKRSHYDEFLHRIQQYKMKELWDNRKDEAWENV